MPRYRQPPKDIVQYANDTAKRVARLERLPRSVSTSIDHGNLTVNGGDINVNKGNFTVVDDSGATIVNFGDLPGLDRGWAFYRPDGTRAMFLNGFGGPGPGQPTIVITDPQGNIVFTDDPVAGNGLSRPFISLHAVKAGDLSAASLQFQTSSTSFQLSHRIHGRQQHPKIEVFVLVFTPAGVTAQIKLTDNVNGGIDIAGPITIPANSFTYAYLTGPLLGDWLTQILCDISIRVASGSGTVGITFAHAYGYGDVVAPL